MVWSKAQGERMNSTNTALAQLDTGNGAAEDEDMDADLTLMRQEMGAGFKEVNSRVDELRREVTARLDESRKDPQRA
jgi:hypothetical protein